MPGEIVDGDKRDIARQSNTTKRAITLTIFQAVELFSSLEFPRSKRSVQRFCEQGHLDCVRIKGARGDQFFINRESIERYAEELRQIEADASITAEPRHDAPSRMRATARQSAPPCRSLSLSRPHPPSSPSETNAQRSSPAPGREPKSPHRQSREGAGDQFHHGTGEGEGPAASRHELPARRRRDCASRNWRRRRCTTTTRHSAPEPIDAIVTEPEKPAPASAPIAPEPRRSVFGRLFG